jgi:hypothetical protein
MRRSRALRDLIAAVIVHPEAGSAPRIEVTGRLAQLTGLDLFPQSKAVAGGGLEPPTSGL